MRIVEVVRNRLEIFSLLAEIKEMNRILETKIEERTGELKNANIKLRCEITDRILKEDAIEVSQKRFLAVLDSLDAIVYVADMETYELYYLNKFAREIFGNVIGKTCWKSLQLDQKSPCDFCSNDMLVDEKGNPKGVYKWEFQNTRNGHWYDIRDRAIYWVDGRLVRLEIATDITERKQAEEALRVRQEMIRALIETSRDWIWSIDLKGMHTYCNSAIEAILGYRPEELVGKRSLDFMHEDDRKMVEGKMPVYIAEKQGWNNLLIRWRHKDGSWRFLESNAVPILNAKGVLIGFRGVDRDITDRKKAEEEKEKLENQLRQAQKMEAIGQLAGGVAHDFNNILTAIIGYGDIIQMKLKEDDPLRIYIDQILASSDRAANLIQSLLAFSRKQIINTHPINLNKLVEGIEKILLRVIGEDIKLRTILAEEEVTVMADSGQIEQVLMNLATNARDAMPEGGLLIIETGLLEFDKEFIAAHEVVKPGKYALISVTDSGVGMDEAMSGKVFEPFFTTKEVGKGTGLGLAMVYGIIKQHGGYIDVYSEQGKGTKFKIYLPLVKAEAKEEEISGLSDVQGGTETVLVAEDDEAVRELTRGVLEQFGYRVIVAEDGADAIDKFREKKDKIQLLILDVVMPRRNGKEAYEEIKKIQYDIKVLFLSGYTADIMKKKGILEEGLNFLLKPVSIKNLLRKMREILDK
jgi:PAS domain S-box-containing protein